MAQREATGWIGWIYFASTMMLILGGLQIVFGLTALFNNDFFVVTNNGLVVWNFTAWGWIHTILGVLVIATALSLLSGRTWARIAASILVVISAVGNLVSLPAYSLWSIIGLVIDGFVLYALTVHGSELRERY
jgi:hypothetical protein